MSAPRAPRTATPWMWSMESMQLFMLIGVIAAVSWWVFAASVAAWVAAWAAGELPLPALPGRGRLGFAFSALVNGPVWGDVRLNGWVWWPVAVGVFAAGVAGLCVLWVWLHRRRAGWRQRNREAERWASPLWATRADVEQMRWTPGSSGWWLGDAVVGDVPLAAPSHSSVQVVAPTRVGKTAGLVVQNILRCPHSLVAIGSKADLVELTMHHRAELGPVYVFDPTDRTGLGNVAWSVLAAASESFAAAKKIAQVFVESVGVEDNAPNAKFWAEHGSKVMAAVIRAATISGAGIQEISRWLHSQDVSTVAEILEFAGELDAAVEWRGASRLPPETRGGVFATAQTLFAAFADPEILAAVDAKDGDADVLDVRALVNSGQVFTLYIICPDDAARRVRPVFEALLGLTLQEGFNRHMATRSPLEPVIGVILEEAGNIAAPTNLDVIASSYAGAGMPLMTVWQDPGQIEKHYGRRARTVIANHTTQVLLRGNLDDEELRRWSTLIGKHLWEQARHQSGTRADSVSVSIDSVEVEVATPDFLRQLPRDAAVIVSGSSKPFVSRLTPWFRDSWARERIPAEVAGRYDRAYGGGRVAA